MNRLVGSADSPREPGASRFPELVRWASRAWLVAWANHSEPSRLNSFSPLLRGHATCGVAAVGTLPSVSPNPIQEFSVPLTLHATTFASRLLHARPRHRWGCGSLNPSFGFCEHHDLLIQKNSIEWWICLEKNITIGVGYRGTEACSFPC